jgi:hypothetical protein
VKPCPGCAQLRRDLRSALADVRLSDGPCKSPDECPSWYDYCNCTRDTLRYNIQRAEKAEAELRALRVEAE